MKKIIALMLTLSLLLCLFAGCGGDENPKDPSEKPKEEKNGVIGGYWVAEKIVMEGTEFSGEDMTGIFGPADTIMAVAFGSDGTFDAVLFEDYIKSTYTGTLEAPEMDFGGEIVKGALDGEDILVLTMKDGSFTLKRQEEMPDSLANNPWVTYAPDFDVKQTADMSNFMSYGYYLIEDEVLYGLTHSETLAGSLGAMSFHMKGDFPEFDETAILDKNGYATYLCKDGDTLYYIRNFEAVCKVNIDGSGAKVLYEGVCDYLQIHEGRLYFADENYHFVSTDMDGGNLTTVVDKEIYYPYFICSDWMIFQDDADDESLHLYNVTHGTELNITYVPSYNPILDGHYLYYTEPVEDRYYLCRIDMSDPETFLFEGSDLPLRESTFMIDDKFIYTTNGISIEKENWQKLTDNKDITEEIYMCVSEGYTVYHEFDSDGLIGRKGLMSKERFGGNSFV